MARVALPLSLSSLLVQEVPSIIPLTEAFLVEKMSSILGLALGNPLGDLEMCVSSLRRADLSLGEGRSSRLDLSLSCRLGSLTSNRCRLG